MSRITIPAWGSIRGKPDFAALYQSILVSGTNIKTINGQSLLGSGDIVVGGSIAWAEITGKPTEFPPSAHNHTSAQITDFAEAVDDEVATLLAGAAGEVTVNYNDALNTLTIGLGANVPRLNAANTFSATQTFSGTIIVGTGVSAVRNATGPTFETRAAGGLRVCNVDGSALGPVACSSVTASGFLDASSIRCDGSQVFDTFAHLSRNALDIGRAGGFNVVAIGGVFGNAQTLIPIGGLTNAFPAWRRTNTEMDLRLADDSAFTSLNLLNLNASGNVQGTFRPTQFTVATLPSAAANTGRTLQVTDSSVDFPGNIGATVAGGGAFNVDVKSNGTNWRITG